MVFKIINAVVITLTVVQRGIIIWENWKRIKDKRDEVPGTRMHKRQLERRRNRTPRED